MVTSAIGRLFWAKFSAAPAAWFNTPDGERLAKQAVDIVRSKHGDEEANVLQRLIETARATPI